MGQFVHRVCPAIQAAGLQVIGNGANEAWHRGTWSDWINYFDGREIEDEPTFDDEGQWRDYLAGFTSMPDKIYVDYLPNPDLYPAIFRFKVASFLLWMGPNSYLACPFSTSSEPIYDPILGLRIGQPTGQCTQVGSKVYRRTFEHGEVFVNISASSSEDVTVGSGLVDATTGAAVQGTVTLAPHQSLILSRG